MSFSHGLSLFFLSFSAANGPSRFYFKRARLSGRGSRYAPSVASVLLCCPVLLSRPSPPLRAVPEARPGPLGDTRRLDRSRRSMQPTRPASSLPPMLLIGLWCKSRDVARALSRTSAYRLVAWSQPHRLSPRPLSRLVHRQVGEARGGFCRVQCWIRAAGAQR